MDAYQGQEWNANNSPTIHQEAQAQSQAQSHGVSASTTGGSGRLPRHRQSQLRRSEGEHLGVLRTAKACGTCRDRKTRCSGHQPTCDYCKRVGIECSYSQTGAVQLPSPASVSGGLDGAGGFNRLGTRLLNGIERLAEKLDLFSHEPASKRRNGSISSSFMCPASISESGNDTHDDEECFSIAVEMPSNITSISSILAWDVFDFAPDAHSFLAEKTTHRLQTRGHESGDTSVSCLMELSRSFFLVYSLELPFVEETELEYYISEIGENGPQWSAESCLVFLVAALGCYCQKSTDLSSEGFRYWNMAKKRLGWALEEPNPLSAQCLILAGMAPAKMMTICLRFQCKIQSDLRIHSIQPIQSPHRLHLRYANEAADTPTSFAYSPFLATRDGVE
ncbi:hypothetical protein WAI453_009306 [Rhynchosporium graminicola]